MGGRDELSQQGVLSVLTNEQGNQDQKKQMNIAGLQIADMFAMPVRRKMLFEAKRAPEPKGLAKMLSDLVEAKFNRRYGSYSPYGYGKVSIF
jgi:hypothetical protein